MRPHRLLVITLLASAISMSCTLPSLLGREASEPPAPTAASSEGAGADGAQAPDMIDATLALRSVSLELEASYPDGPARRVTAEIDANGNLHLTDPVDPGPQADEAFIPPAEGWGSFELFIVDGRAYTLMTGDEAVPDGNYLDFLEETLRGPDGPGMWLLWAGTEELGPDGRETFLGFSAIRYPVAADVGPGRIEGTVWVDEATSALVGADLTVSPELFSTSAPPANGDLVIKLRVSRESVSPIAVP